MKHRPGLALAGIAAASWITVITVDTMNLHSHVERDMLAVATILTLATFQWTICRQLRQSMDQMGEAYRALAQAVATRPVYRDPTGPIPVVPPHAVPASNGHTQRGRHATR